MSMSVRRMQTRAYAEQWVCDRACEPMYVVRKKLGNLRKAASMRANTWEMRNDERWNTPESDAYLTARENREDGMLGKLIVWFDEHNISVEFLGLYPILRDKLTGEEISGLGW